MLSPELIHPALWRAAQLAQGAARCIATGYPALSAQLPHGGWPLGTLIELLHPHAGMGELRLLRPALCQLERGRTVALVQPPHVPHIASWSSWRLDPRQLLWIDPPRPNDALWAAEQILRSGACAALLCWLPRARTESLRRLHLAAQRGDTLFFALRPASAARQASPAPLRLALASTPQGLSIHILKRQGPKSEDPVTLALEPGTPLPLHAPLDRRLPVQPAAGRHTPALVG